MKMRKFLHITVMKSFVLTCIALCGLVLPKSAEAATFGGLAFNDPQQAISALRDAVAAKDKDRLLTIFGPDLKDLINPDPVEAANEFEFVAKGLEEYSKLMERGPDRMILEYGNDKTDFPVPLVKSEGKWYFDTVAGKEELDNRRVGRNELEALDTIRTYVVAQREYASQDRDDDEVLEYAQKFASSPGMKDGLYWPLDLDGTMSPLGPLVAEASAAGYRKTKEERQSFHGYFFKILTKQGKNAPGGAYDYVINGNMIGGFALVAWPAEYDETGVMTFIVNQQGKVYQKDLGTNSAKSAEAMTVYDPDSTWVVSKD
jgi:hypothetical protein